MVVGGIDMVVVGGIDMVVVVVGVGVLIWWHGGDVVVVVLVLLWSGYLYSANGDTGNVR